MPNNIYDDTVSEKAIWEGSITPDNDTPSFASQMQSQPQMIFCYKCNQVIPGNSTYCPYCQVKLFTECPKCGAKYSSQYPSCSQCGTNREEFLQRQREWEWEQEELRIKLQKDEEEKKKTYYAENEEIIKTEEYKSAYALFVNAFEARNKKLRITGSIAAILPSLPTFYSFGMLIFYGGEYQYLRLFFISLPIYALSMVIYLLTDVFFLKNVFFKKHISKRLKGNKYDKDIITPEFIEEVNAWMQYYHHHLSDIFPDYYIISYRRKNKMPIYKKWHSYSY